MSARVGWGPRLTTAALRVLPQHLLARGMYRLARSRWRPVRQALIEFVRRRYAIDMREALEPDPDHYDSFNSFFTRALKPSARLIAGGEDVVVSPADGTISQIGTIEQGRLLQAKGIDYGLADLLAADADSAALFDGGVFATIYLSPRDYHRVHMPVDGQLTRMDFVPGDLFSVSDATAQLVPGLFARNERVINLFETPCGSLALILVGAIFVGSMETVWAGEVRSADGRVVRQDYADDPPKLARGDEMGRFNMGSTVIMLFPPDRVRWSAELAPGDTVRMGQAIGRRTR